MSVETEILAARYDALKRDTQAKLNGEESLPVFSHMQLAGSIFDQAPGILDTNAPAYAQFLAEHRENLSQAYVPGDRGIASVVAQRVANSFLSAFASLPKAFAGLEKWVDKTLFNNYFIGDLDTADTWMYRFGQAAQELVDEVAEVGEEYKDSFWLDVIPQGFGSLASFFVPGTLATKMTKGVKAAQISRSPWAFVGGVFKPKSVGYAQTEMKMVSAVEKAMKRNAMVGAGILGAALEGVQQYEAAKAFGASEEKALQAFAWGSIVGTSESWPVGRAFDMPFYKPATTFARRFLPEALSPTVRMGLTRAILSGAEEAAQEIFQGTSGNIIAQKLYDKNRKMFEHVGVAGAAGGVLGGIMGFTTGFASARRRSRYNQYIKEHGNSIQDAVDTPSGPAIADIDAYALLNHHLEVLHEQVTDPALLQDWERTLVQKTSGLKGAAKQQAVEAVAKDLAAEVGSHILSEQEMEVIAKYNYMQWRGDRVENAPTRSNIFGSGDNSLSWQVPLHEVDVADRATLEKVGVSWVLNSPNMQDNLDAYDRITGAETQTQKASEVARIAERALRSLGIQDSVEGAEINGVTIGVNEQNAAQWAAHLGLQKSEIYKLGANEDEFIRLGGRNRKGTNGNWKVTLSRTDSELAWKNASAEEVGEIILKSAYRHNESQRSGTIDPNSKSSRLVGAVKGWLDTRSAELDTWLRESGPSLTLEQADTAKRLLAAFRSGRTQNASDQIELFGKMYSLWHNNNAFRTGEIEQAPFLAPTPELVDVLNEIEGYKPQKIAENPRPVGLQSWEALRDSVQTERISEQNAVADIQQTLQNISSFRAPSGSKVHGVFRLDSFEGIARDYFDIALDTSHPSLRDNNDVERSKAFLRGPWVVSQDHPAALTWVGNVLHINPVVMAQDFSSIQAVTPGQYAQALESRHGFTPGILSQLGLDGDIDRLKKLSFEQYTVYRLIRNHLEPYFAATTPNSLAEETRLRHDAAQLRVAAGQAIFDPAAGSVQDVVGFLGSQLDDVLQGIKGVGAKVIERLRAGDPDGYFSTPAREKQLRGWAEEIVGKMDATRIALQQEADALDLAADQARDEGSLEKHLGAHKVALESQESGPLAEGSKEIVKGLMRQIAFYSSPTYQLIGQSYFSEEQFPKELTLKQPPTIAAFAFKEGLGRLRYASFRFEDANRREILVQWRDTEPRGWSFHIPNFGVKKSGQPFFQAEPGYAGQSIPWYQTPGKVSDRATDEIKAANEELRQKATAQIAELEQTARAWLKANWSRAILSQKSPLASGYWKHDVVKFMTPRDMEDLTAELQEVYNEFSEEYDIEALGKAVAQAKQTTGRLISHYRQVLEGKPESQVRSSPRTVHEMVELAQVTSLGAAIDTQPADDTGASLPPATERPGEKDAAARALINVSVLDRMYRDLEEKVVRRSYLSETAPGEMADTLRRELRNVLKYYRGAAGPRMVAAEKQYEDVLEDDYRDTPKDDKVYDATLGMLSVTRSDSGYPLIPAVTKEDGSVLIPGMSQWLSRMIHDIQNIGGIAGKKIDFAALRAEHKAWQTTRKSREASKAEKEAAEARYYDLLREQTALLADPEFKRELLSRAMLQSVPYTPDAQWRTDVVWDPNMEGNENWQYKVFRMTTHDLKDIAFNRKGAELSPLDRVLANMAIVQRNGGGLMIVSDFVGFASPQSNINPDNLQMLKVYPVERDAKVEFMDILFTELRTRFTKELDNARHRSLFPASFREESQKAEREFRVEQEMQEKALEMIKEFGRSLNMDEVTREESDAIFQSRYEQDPEEIQSQERVGEDDERFTRADLLADRFDGLRVYQGFDKPVDEQRRVSVTHPLGSSMPAKYFETLDEGDNIRSFFFVPSQGYFDSYFTRIVNADGARILSGPAGELITTFGDSFRVPFAQVSASWQKVKDWILDGANVNALAKLDKRAAFLYKNEDSKKALKENWMARVEDFLSGIEQEAVRLGYKLTPAEGFQARVKALDESGFRVRGNAWLNVYTPRSNDLAKVYGAKGEGFADRWMSVLSDQAIADVELILDPNTTDVVLPADHPHFDKILSLAASPVRNVRAAKSLFPRIPMTDDQALMYAFGIEPGSADYELAVGWSELDQIAFYREGRVNYHQSEAEGSSGMEGLWLKGDSNTEYGRAPAFRRVLVVNPQNVDMIGTFAKAAKERGGNVVYLGSKVFQVKRTIQRELPPVPEGALDDAVQYNALPSPVEGQRTMTYAGVGSRETPSAIQSVMKRVAKQLEAEGYTLRTGDAKGADSAFASGASKKEIFTARDATDQTRAIAREIHPRPDALGEFALNLQARNTNQVFGRDLDTPVDFLLAWTPDGAETWTETGHGRKDKPNTGGTGQAIRLASGKGIPVINLAKEGWQARLRSLVGPRQSESRQLFPDNVVQGDVWDQPGVVVVSTNLGGVHGRGLAAQAKQKGFITAQNKDFDSSPSNGRVITLAVKGKAPETAKVPGRAFSEQVIGENVALLESEVDKLIQWARENPSTQINLPFIGLGFGEGSQTEILPILQRAAAEPNIVLVSKDSKTVERYADSFRPGVRQDSSGVSYQEPKVEEEFEARRDASDQSYQLLSSDDALVGNLEEASRNLSKRIQIKGVTFTPPPPLPDTFVHQVFKYVRADDGSWTSESMLPWKMKDGYQMLPPTFIPEKEVMKIWTRLHGQWDYRSLTFAEMAETIDEWKTDLRITYDPQEAYSRGEAFYHDVGAYNPLAQTHFANLTSVILEQSRALKKKDIKYWEAPETQIVLSVYTAPPPSSSRESIRPGSQLSPIRLVIRPAPQDIMWAAFGDVSSGVVRKQRNSYLPVPSTIKNINHFELHMIAGGGGGEILYTRTEDPDVWEVDSSTGTTHFISAKETQKIFDRGKIDDRILIPNKSQSEITVEPKAPNYHKSDLITASVGEAVEGRWPDHNNEFGVRIRLGSFYIEFAEDFSPPAEMLRLNDQLKKAFLRVHGSLDPIQSYTPKTLRRAGGFEETFQLNSGSWATPSDYLRGRGLQNIEEIGTHAFRRKKWIGQMFGVFANDLRKRFDREDRKALIAYIQETDQWVTTEANAPAPRGTIQTMTFPTHSAHMVATYQDLKNRFDSNPKVKELVDRYKKMMAYFREETNEYWDEKGMVKVDPDRPNRTEYLGDVTNYVPQMWQFGEEDPDFKLNMKGNPHEESRKFDSYSQGIRNGFVPRFETLDNLVEMYAHRAAEHGFAEYARNTLTGFQIEPGVKLMIPQTDENGNPTMAPKGYKGLNAHWLMPGGAWVHEAGYNVVRNMTQPRFNGRFVRALELINGLAKYTQLSVSFFHHGALNESFMAALGYSPKWIKEFRAENPNLSRNPFKFSQQLIQDPEFQQRLAAAGISLNATNDVFKPRIDQLFEKVEKSLEGKPLLGRFIKRAQKIRHGWDDFLWNQMFNNMKVMTFLSQSHSLRQKFPHLTQDEIDRQLGPKINAAYGGLNWDEMWMLSPQFRQALQWTMLSPDWTASNLSIALNWNLGTPASQKEAAMEFQKGYWRRMLLNMVLVTQGLQWIIAKLWGTPDDPEEEGDESKRFFFQNKKIGAKDLFSWEITPLIHRYPLLAKMAGIKPEERIRGNRAFSHGYKQVNEIIGYAMSPPEKLLAKLSPVMRFVQSQLWSASSPGFALPFAEMPFWESVPLRLADAASYFAPFSFSSYNPVADVLFGMDTVQSGGAFLMTTPVNKVSDYTLRKAMKETLAAYAHVHEFDLNPARAIRETNMDLPGYVANLEVLVAKQIEAAVASGYSDDEIKKLFTSARGDVTGDLFKRFFDASEEGDLKKMEYYAGRLTAFGKGLKDFKRSADGRGIDLTTNDLLALETLLSPFQVALW